MREKNSSEKYLTLILLSGTAWWEYKLLYRHITGTQLTRNKQYRKHLAWISRARVGVLMCNSMSFPFAFLWQSENPKSRVMFWRLMSEQQNKKLFHSIHAFSLSIISPKEEKFFFQFHLVKCCFQLERLKKLPGISQYWLHRKGQERAKRRASLNVENVLSEKCKHIKILKCNLCFSTFNTWPVYRYVIK